MTRLAPLLDRLRESLWFIPGISAVVAVIVAAVLVGVDRRLADDPGGFAGFVGSAEGARSVLSTISASMLTFTALVFSITMLVLQLASSQLSPRVTRTFLRDRNNQVVLGLFIATFLYTLLVLREVRSPQPDGESFVPGLSVWVAILLAVASVGAFIYYIHHMAHAIQSATVVRTIGDETRTALEGDPYPAGIGDDSPPDFVATLPERAATVTADHPGTITGVDGQALLDAACSAVVVLVVPSAIGDFVPEGAALCIVHGAPSPGWDRERLERVARSAVVLGDSRTMSQDPAFGIRQLVDVGTRALSPGTNDPTTAVEVIDQLHDLLRRLAARPLPTAERFDNDATLRLVLNRPGFEAYLHLAVAELRMFGAGQLQVARRLRHLLDDLAGVCRPEYRPAILDEQARLDRAIARDLPDAADRDLAALPSGSGQGPPPL